MDATKTKSRKRELTYGINPNNRSKISFDRSYGGLIFGNSGSGKTTVIRNEVSQILSLTKDAVVIISNSQDYYDLVAKFGGIVVDVSKSMDFDKNNRFVILDISNMTDKIAAAKFCTDYILERSEKEQKHNLEHDSYLWGYFDGLDDYFYEEETADLLTACKKQTLQYLTHLTFAFQDVMQCLSTSQGRSIFNSTSFFIVLKQDSLISREQLKIFWKLSDNQTESMNQNGAGIGLIYPLALASTAIPIQLDFS